MGGSWNRRSWSLQACDLSAHYKLGCKVSHLFLTNQSGSLQDMRGPAWGGPGTGEVGPSRLATSAHCKLHFWQPGSLQDMRGPAWGGPGTGEVGPSRLVTSLHTTNWAVNLATGQPTGYERACMGGSWNRRSWSLQACDLSAHYKLGCKVSHLFLTNHLVWQPELRKPQPGDSRI
ncbi:hypothetical protein Bbelb_119940 [Branchiostoma belcheri]|nr:hypothetical protein Bbelb_119940 [Branchiostoma belcheri]